MQKSPVIIKTKPLVWATVVRNPKCYCMLSRRAYKKYIKPEIERAKIKRFVQKEFINTDNY